MKCDRCPGVWQEVDNNCIGTFEKMRELSAKNFRLDFELLRNVLSTNEPSLFFVLFFFNRFTTLMAEATN